MATLSAWPPILPNQAPGKDGSDNCMGREWGEGVMGVGAKRNHEKEGGLDKGK